MKETMRAIGVTYTEYLFAMSDESAIEACACDCRTRPDRADELKAAVEALSWIDSSVIAGSYEAERKTLSAQTRQNEWFRGFQEGYIRWMECLSDKRVRRG